MKIIKIDACYFVLIYLLAIVFEFNGVDLRFYPMIRTYF